MVEGFADALKAVAAITTYGADKYTEHGWLHVPNAQDRYSDALYRHLIEHARGELHDKESGHLHLAHAAWNALAILQLLINKWGENVVLPRKAEPKPMTLDDCQKVQSAGLSPPPAEIQAQQDLSLKLQQQYWVNPLGQGRGGYIPEDP
jgi:hypothetical protein